MAADYHDVPERPNTISGSSIRSIFNTLSEQQPNVYKCESRTMLAMIFSAIEIYIDLKIGVGR